MGVSEGVTVMANLFQGVLRGQTSPLSLENVKEKFQLLLFYPGDRSAQSQELLTQFSGVERTLVASDCLVYGVSTDSVQSHQEWLAETHLDPAFPLISDPTASLAYKYGIYSREEEDGQEKVVKVEDLPPCTCVVITDNQSVLLELVNTSLAVEELVTYTQERLNMLLQKRKMAVDRARNRDRVDLVDHNLQLQLKLNTFSASLASQRRDRSDSRGRSMGRSLSRSRDRLRLSQQQNKDPLFEQHLKRTVDRMVKGYF